MDAVVASTLRFVLAVESGLQLINVLEAGQVLDSIKIRVL